MEYANYPPNNYPPNNYPPNNYPPNNENLDKFADDFLNNYYGYNNDNMEFPEDNELDNMYDNIEKEYMKMHGNYGQAYVSQGFNNFLWLALIGALYRRYPYYRGRCRWDRRYCGGAWGPGGGWGGQW